MKSNSFLNLLSEKYIFMKAIRIHEYGSLAMLKLEDIDIPQPSSTEVLIKVHASSVNPVDQKIISGEAEQKFPTKFPLTIGWDVSGVIEKLGTDVKNLKVGDEVYGRPFPTKNGAFAEYIVTKAEWVSAKPKSVDHLKAAAIPLAGLTAWQGLFKFGHLDKGQKVLIHAAAGGVGTFAIQFAKWKGAYVIGTASSANLDFIKQLGADEVIDYHHEEFENLIEDVDLVLDLVGGETQKRSLDIIKEGGRLITTVMPQFIDDAKAKRIHLEGFTAQSYPADLKLIAELVDEGKIEPIISSILSLEDAAKAEELSENGHPRGKIVIKVV